MFNKENHWESSSVHSVIRIDCMCVCACVCVCTCFSPNRQVFILLDVQHDLQAVACASFHRSPQSLPLFGSVKHVTLPITCKHLERGKGKVYWTSLMFFLPIFILLLIPTDNHFDSLCMCINAVYKCHEIHLNTFLMKA